MAEPPSTAQRNADDDPAHGLAQLEVVARAVRLGVVAGDACGRNRDIRVHSPELPVRQASRIMACRSGIGKCHHWPTRPRSPHEAGTKSTAASLILLVNEAERGDHFLAGGSESRPAGGANGRLRSL